MRDIRQPPACHPGVARPATPQRSPQFLPVGHDGDNRFFSCLEADTSKTFFQFHSPAREKGRPFIKKHWDCVCLIKHMLKCSVGLITILMHCCIRRFLPIIINILLKLGLKSNLLCSSLPQQVSVSPRCEYLFTHRTAVQYSVNIEFNVTSNHTNKQLSFKFVCIFTW